jgi:outer membrane receptor for ferrienterochelin and colicins
MRGARFVAPAAMGFVCALTSPAVAQVQTMDLGALQELFGEPIITSATGKPERRSEVPAGVDIITAEDIRRSGATGIPELLSRLASIDVYTWSKNSADVAIRGMNQGASNRLLVLVNGRETYTDALGTVAWPNIPVRLDEIRQIEVIKGPNSALYGFNAAAGVINIITFNPQYDSTDAQRVTVGTDGYQEASLVKTAHWSTGGVRLSGDWTKAPESQFHPFFAGDRLATADPALNRTLNLDSQVAIGERTKLRLQGAVADSTLRGMYLFPFYLKNVFAAGQADLSSETAIGLIDASLWHNHIDVAAYRHTLAAGSLSNEVTVAKLQDLFKLGAADTFRLGTEYRHDSMPSYPVGGAALQSDTAALSGMWEHVLTPGFRLLNALRGDRFTLSRSGIFLPGTPFTNSDYDRIIYAWSFNSAAVWQPTNVDSLKASLGRGLTLPSLTELGVMNHLTVPFAPPFIPTAALNSVGNPNLAPTRVLQAELSYGRELPPLGASARVGLFHQFVTGLRDLTNPQLVSPPPAPLLMSTYANIGSAHLNGIEAEATGHIALKWRWGANYRYETVAGDSSRDQFHDFVRSTPRHKVDLSVGWDGGPWEADFTLRYVSAAAMPQQVAFGQFSLEPVEATVAVSQRVAYRLSPRLRLEAVGTSGFADNPVSSEERRLLFSIVGNY